MGNEFRSPGEYTTLAESKYSPGGIQHSSSTGKFRSHGRGGGGGGAAMSFAGGNAGSMVVSKYEVRHESPQVSTGGNGTISGRKKKNKYANVSSRLFEPTKAMTMKSRRVEHKDI
jgi:hypothetical protein